MTFTEALLFQMLYLILYVCLFAAPPLLWYAVRTGRRENND